MKLTKISYLAVMAALIAGCEKAVKEPVASSADAPSKVLVTVDGKAFTEAMLEREISINSKFMRIAQPQIKPEMLEKAAQKLREIAAKRFVDREVLQAEAERRGMTVSEEEVTEIRQTMVKALDPSGALTFEGLLEKLTPEEAKAFSENLTGDKLNQKIYAALAEETAVTPDEAEQQRVYGNYQKYQAKILEREAEIFSRATNIWKRITGGGDFDEIGAEAKDEHTKFDPNWGKFELQYFKDDEELCEKLAKMSAGDVTPPVEADNGLMIVKLLDIVPVDVKAGIMNQQYHLAEIFFELPEKFGTYKDKAAFIEDYVKEMSGIALKEKIKELKAKAKVVFAKREKSTVGQKGAIKQ